MVRWTLTIALLLALPSAAGAQTCVARPGTAALDQYCETIPSGGGQRSTRPTNPRLRDTLPPDEVSRLQRRGDEGNAVLALPSGPAPPSAPSSAVSSGSHELSKVPPGALPAAGTDAPPAAPSANPVSAAFSSLGFVGSLGWGLVALLAVLAVVASAAAWSSSRRPGPSGTGPSGRRPT
jgi:hypothetical protein